MEFPSFTPRISELYGASGGALRVGEAHAYAQDLDDLEREERALDNMVQKLVNRPASVPIGVKFHRDGVGSVPQQVAEPSSDSFEGGGVAQVPDMQFVRSSSSEEEAEDDDDDLDEDEMMEEDDEEEEDTTGRATIVRGEGQHRDEDSFARDMPSGDESMEMEEELPLPSDWH